MRDWHDWHLSGYTVDGAARRIVFDVSWPYETTAAVRRAQLVFSGVEGYFFERDLGGNILEAIRQEPLEAFIHANAPWFQCEQRQWGWPLFWQGEADNTIRHLRAADARLFCISSSYGLDGWILAQSAEAHVAGQ